ncbi:alpha-glucosidase-like isoform X2 [Frieseomelitta varia]|nr:alpha-glucosidase-like isoform X2 [Frieseomelitta varia]XP_043521919.1 alpha-glucosidase-like isoform X2 [Frieseomelitta varia]XP_043521921.1 alpha-glucosidase-like isoform X2 [Frieseomelitta varia]
MRAVIAFCVAVLPLVIGITWEPSENAKDFSLYQIYPRSYMDSDGDGVGDLRGIIQRLDHMVASNLDAIWLSPIYRSPMVDFGYDISNYTDIDPTFGTMKDFDDLLKAAHDKNLLVIMDFVPNHTSDQHEWFQKSVQGISPYDNYYVWHTGQIENGTRKPPNNWVSEMHGSAWEWKDERQAYYLHQFAIQQPDLNYNSPDVRREIEDVLRFWLDKGVDGFRIDAMIFLYEDQRFLDEPLSGLTDDPDVYDYTEKIYTTNQQPDYDILPTWRKVLDEYEQPKYIMIEAYSNMSDTMKYYHYGADFPFNFYTITNLTSSSSAADIKHIVDSWYNNMPEGSTPNWVAGNHDHSRLIARLGEPRARAVTMSLLLLPGVSVTYYGEEIGMTDAYISWEDTVDPEGCRAGKANYQNITRDPERTPFQWNDTVAAGFSSNSHTWLPVNPNYKTLNLADEKKDKNSYYTLYEKLSKLKKSPHFKQANLVTEVLDEYVFAFARETEKHGSVYAITNFGDEDSTVDLSVFDNIPSKLDVYYASAISGILSWENVVQVQHVTIPAASVVILTTPNANFVTG